MTALVGSSGAASAAAGHDPFGNLDALRAGANGAVTVTGWAADPDALNTRLTIVFTVDGGRAGQVVESVARPDVAMARGTGGTTGYSGTVVTTPGRHTICALARNIGAGTSGPVGCADLTVPTPSASALAHYPIGNLDSAKVSNNTVTVTGWAVDPDALSTPLWVGATVDGRASTTINPVAVARPDVSKVMKAGPKQGYSFILNVANGQHSVCVYAGNVGAGGPNTTGCTSIQVGPLPLTPQQIQAHSPSGALEATGAVNGTTMQVRGWASDPDNRNYPLVTVAYVDGVAHTPVRATLPRPDLSGNSKAGPNAGFDYALSVSTGSHIVCMWAVNIGIGTNQSLGCAPVSTPAVSMATGPRPATPAVNNKIVAAAKQFLGGKYVWGGEDPKVGFDCSGLVQYTYRGNGVSTPRVAEDQFRAAHMITAGRAVPGDLVFYHDDEGNVYHVGIYVSPGLTYAAVDEAEGIRIQPIWDSTATYGSFTHS